MCFGWVIDLGVLCGSAAGLAEEWIRALRMSSTRVPNPVGSAQPATSVAGPSFAGRSGHDGGTLAATPRARGAGEQVREGAQHLLGRLEPAAGAAAADLPASGGGRLR